MWHLTSFDLTIVGGIVCGLIYGRWWDCSSLQGATRLEVASKDASDGRPIKDGLFLLLSTANAGNQED